MQGLFFFVQANFLLLKFRACKDAEETAFFKAYYG